MEVTELKVNRIFARRPSLNCHPHPDRPDLINKMWAVPNQWPTFLLQDVVSDFCYDQRPVRYPEYPLVAVGGDQVRARVNAVPYAWSGVEEDLPGDDQGQAG